MADVLRQNFKTISHDENRAIPKWGDPPQNNKNRGGPPAIFNPILKSTFVKKFRHEGNLTREIKLEID